MSGYAHPVFWLLDLAAGMTSGDHRAAPVGGQQSASLPPPPRRRPPPSDPRPWRLTFEVLDEHYGPCLECHELRPAAPVLREWHAVLAALEDAGRLLWWKLDR